jgi:hypothetical protein
MMDHHSIIPDSGAAATDPGSRNENKGALTLWTPAFAGER